MSIPAVNATYLAQGPTVDQQILAPNEQSGLRVAYIGTATFTLDGSTTAVTLNFIDGTAALPFTPTGLFAHVIGGTQNAASPVSVVASIPTNNKVAVLTLSGAGTNANTVKVLFSIVK